MHVAEWLESLPTTKSGVAPVAVKIGRETFYGATYWEAGEHASPEPIMYLLGNRPVSYRRGRVAYRFTNREHIAMANGDTCGCSDCSDDWYIAGFADARACRLFPEAHAFGPWFQLRKWPTGICPHTGKLYESIDAHERVAYRRMRIELVG